MTAQGNSPVDGPDPSESVSPEATEAPSVSRPVPTPPGSTPRPVPTAPRPAPPAPAAPAVAPAAGTGSAAAPEPASAPAPVEGSAPATSEWGRVAEDGTVYARTADGERAVGQYPEGTPEEALAFFTRRFDALAFEVQLLEQRVRAGALSPDEATDSVKKVGGPAGRAARRR